MGRIKTLDKERLEGFLGLVDNLVTHSYSIRIFNEVYQNAMEILKEHGKKRSFFGRDRRYSQNGFSLSYTISNKNKFDALSICHFGAENGNLIILSKQKGCLTRKRIMELDGATMVARGIGMDELLKGLREYEPGLLYQYDNMDGREDSSVYDYVLGDHRGDVNVLDQLRKLNHKIRQKTIKEMERVS